MLYQFIIKRSFDFVFALLCIVILSPLIVIITILLFFTNNGTPFFFQKRPGKNEKIFSIVKFKTMNDKKDKNGILLSDTDRLTLIGKIVRKTSLDEIPQFFNIIKGDMSLIGPRPLLIRYLPYYTEKEKIRHTVKPGITGLAQVSGRNLLNWDARLAADVEYVTNISLMMDIKIIIKTIKNVILSKDVVLDPQTAIQDLDEYREQRT
ncbi:sugar transferase [Flavobacteriaceae bacterium R38]|nr:sugar transferase [Flavobacteriaceae bacterium R38]